MHLSSTERKILNCIQQELPLVSSPFKILSKKLHLEEAVLLKSVKQLKKKGFIRSFSAGLNHKKLKFQSSLIALKVPSGKIQPIVEKITNYQEVTHCYLRQGEYNLWVVFLYKNGKLKQFLKKMTRQIGAKNIFSLPTIRQFKLKTRLRV